MSKPRLYKMQRGQVACLALVLGEILLLAAGPGLRLTPLCNCRDVACDTRSGDCCEESKASPSSAWNADTFTCPVRQFLADSSHALLTGVEASEEQLLVATAGRCRQRLNVATMVPTYESRGPPAA